MKFCSTVCAVPDELKTTKQKIKDMDYKRINNDVNGNPRYVFHFLAFLNDKEQETIRANARPFQAIDDMYREALNKARELGGKVYRGKDFGGGVVFQSYNVNTLIKAIENLR